MEGAAALSPAHFGTGTVPSEGGRCSEGLIEGPFSNYLFGFGFVARGFLGGYW